MTTAWQRCFIALAPCTETRQRLADLPVDPRARRVAAADLHLTLAFLGGLTDSQRQELADALPTLARPLPALDFSGIEYWPGPQHARVEVATFVLPEPLARLLECLNPLLTDMGLPVDSRSFRPHVTLARFPHGKSAFHASAGDTAPPFPAARFQAITLYARSTAQQGVRYMALASQALDSMADT